MSVIDAIDPFSQHAATQGLRVRVVRIAQEALGIRSFELVRIDGRSMPAFSAGAHVDVLIAPGLTRQYSLCGHPSDLSCYVIAVKEEPNSRGGSRAMHENVREGHDLSISLPRNNFGLVADAKKHVLVAGGVGITPMLSMAEQLSDGIAAYEVHYFSRSQQHAAFEKHLSQARFQPNARAHYGVGPETMDDYLRQVLPAYEAGSYIYLCGPAAFMAAVRQQAVATGWPEDAVHVEHFTANTSALARPVESFTVRLARTGGSYEVSAGQTIVDALAACGVTLETSCRAGVCGTCMTNVLDGIPDHRDNFLTEQERAASNKIMPCVSRSLTTSLVLDC